MLNKLEGFLREHRMISPGDLVTCAVSGGADSMALLWSVYLLKEKLQIDLRAAHFNHRLRGAESDRDEAFVRSFCDGYGIPLFVESGEVKTGKKGLEAAARDARYAFLRSLPGKIATAHTADDNAETVLMHLVRGTGLKGLGAISPISGNVIRPMLSITRAEVEAFLQEYHVDYITDSSNETDAFLRNRLRHHVMPLLRTENPKISENLSAMALRLRQDEAALHDMTKDLIPVRVSVLREQSSALRTRVLEQFLKDAGVKEPESQHIELAQALVFSDNPSARGNFPGGITISRNYDTLEVLQMQTSCHISPICEPAAQIINTAEVFTVRTVGTVRIRPREAGDAMRLSGGTKSLKKLFIDRKIPAAQRQSIPVVFDDAGIIGVYGIGVNLDRAATALPATQIHFQHI